MEKAESATASNQSSFFGTVIGLFEPFHTTSGETFVAAMVNDYVETLSTKSKAFSLLLSKLHYENRGKVPCGTVVKDTITMIEAEAMFNGPERKVSVRVAEENGAIYVDLGNKEHQQVKITAEGWEVISSDKSPIYFLRSPRMVPMAMPQKNGSLEKLWDFVNLEDKHDKILALAWLLSTFQPNGPYPILNIQGEQGTGKTSLCKLLRELVDPSFPAIGSLPGSERDLAISSYKTRVLAFDNISKMSDWLSDAFCRLSTGGGFATRALYTDDAEIVFDIKMPLIVNGITDLFSRNDLIERSIFLTTTPIPADKRVPEEVIKTKWAEAKPGIIGAMFDAVSMALKNKDMIKLKVYPRMADFVQWIVAAEPALPWAEDTFLHEYNRNRLKSIDNAIEADPVAAGIQKLIEKDGYWSSTPTELLTALSLVTSEDIKRSQLWPKHANSLSGRIHRCAPFLRERLVDIEFSKSGQRKITIISKDKKDNAAILEKIGRTFTVADEDHSQTLCHPAQSSSQLGSASLLPQHIQ